MHLLIIPMIVQRWNSVGIFLGGILAPLKWVGLFSLFSLSLPLLFSVKIPDSVIPLHVHACLVICSVHFEILFSTLL